MQKILSLTTLLVIGTAVFYSACKPQPESTEGDLNLIIKGQHNGETVVLFESQHNTPDNNSINYQVVNFFLSDINLIRDDGSRMPLTDIHFVDLKDNHSLANTAENGESILFENIEVGTYTGIEMGFGVPESKNGQTPADFSTASPLGDASHYWTAWNSYIFSRMEGRYVDDGTVISFLYHSGSDDSYQSRTFTKDIVINADATTDVVFTIDLEKVFYPDTGTPIVIPDMPASHSGAIGTPEYEVVKNSLINLANAFEFAP